LDTESCRRYAEAFDRYSGNLEDLALRSSGRYAGLSTSIPIDEAIFTALDRAGASMERVIRSA